MSQEIQKAETKPETIQAVDRALQILETIGRVNSMSLAELNKEIKSKN